MKKAILIILGIVILFLGGVYFLYQPPTDRFPASTTINHMDVSGLTPEEAGEKLSERWRNKNFAFVYRGKAYNVPMRSLSYEISLEDVMSSLSRLENFRYFVRLGNEFEVQMKPGESAEFLEEIANLPFCANEGKTKSTDAYVDLSDFDFRVVKETIGTEVDPEVIRDIAYASIEKGSFTAGLNDDEIVRQPELKADSDEFRERLKYCKDNLNFRLEVDTIGGSETIMPETLDGMVTYKEDGPEFHNKKIRRYVDGLAGKCNEYQKTYDFTTHGGNVISVQAVTFGRVLDKDGMVKALKEALTSQKSQEIELKWAQTKFNGGEGIGDSYIETSIAEQHVWCYRNGKCVVDCDCVTGSPGHDTARGVFFVYYVTGPMTLTGNNGDGSTYASPVNCFMPFYGDQGFHGSNGWRSQWGGNIYKTSGSHGCVNCPDAAARKMADIVSSGYPVVIY